jgi:hypothetical protein
VFAEVKSGQRDGERGREKKGKEGKEKRERARTDSGLRQNWYYLLFSLVSRRGV